MSIPWKAQTLRWFEEASDYTRFHQRLIDRMLPHMPCRDTVVDLALAQHAGHITCVDKNREVLHFVASAAQRRDILNLTTQCADAMRLEARWDTAIMLFSGPISRNIGQLLSLCTSRAVAVVRADRHGHLGPSSHHPLKHDTVSSIAAAFDARGVRYRLIKDVLEYGQPLQSMEEARAFVRTYSKAMPGDALDAYLAEKLLHTGEEAYPYYLPNLKRFGIFVMDKAENAHILPQDDAIFAQQMQAI